MKATKPAFRWGIPVCIGLIMFANHFARDSVGALEKELEIGTLQPQQYALLNLFFFIPNVITPLVAGALISPSSSLSLYFFLSIFIASIGHTLFAWGIAATDVTLMYFGRSLAGAMYEIVDVLMPVTYQARLFDAQDWGLVVGIMNLFLRLGSAINFWVTPIVYSNFGIASAYWVAASISFSSLLVMSLAVYLENLWEAGEKKGGGYEVVMQTALDEVESDDNSNFDSNSNYNENSTKKSNSDSSDKSFISSLIPFDRLSSCFYFYALGGACLYGSMVPFWFIGSKFLQNKYGLTVVQGDALLILPEGLIIFVSLPLGIYLKKYKATLGQKLRALAISAVLMSLSYAALVFSVPAQINPSTGNENISAPLVAIFFLGLSYAFSNVLYWGAITETSDPDILSFASGVISCAVNVLPACLPAALSVLLGPENLTGVVIALGAFAALTAVCVATSARYSDQRDDISKNNESNDNSTRGSNCDSSSNYKMKDSNKQVAYKDIELTNRSDD